MTTNNSTNANVGGAQLAAHSLVGNTTGSAANPAAVLTSGFLQTVTKQVFTSSGTYTPTAGMVYCIAEGVGGGGAGGGATSSASNSGVGAGGGSGGYSRVVLTAAQVGGSQTVTIGAGGTAGSTGNNPGGNGGNTSLGSLLVANGGTGGGGSAAASGGLGGAGGTAGTGDLALAGQDGDGGLGQPITTIFSFTGRGGSSYFGGSPAASRASASVTGVNAANYGAGGNGGASWSGGGDVAGGTGFKGIIFITEFVAL